MIHPASLTVEPTRDPDYSEFAAEAWFNEMTYSWRRSCGEWQVCPMIVCPLTGELMYMAHSWPLCWVQIINSHLKESYMRYLVEKELLGAFEDVFNDND